MKKLIDRLTVIVFFIFTAMIGVSMLFFGGRYTETSETSGTPIENIRQQLSDNFPIKKNFSALYSRSAKILGRREFGGVYYDRDGGRLIEIFSEADEQSTNAAVASINSFHKAHGGLPTYVMLVPTASGIYRGDIRGATGALDQRKLIDDLYYRIDAEITPLDVWSEIYSVRDNYIYYRTDTRWTQQGAYAAYSASISKLGAEVYGTANYDVDYTHTEFRGSLCEKSGITDVTADTVNAYRCKYGSYVKECRTTAEGQEIVKKSVYAKSGLRGEDKYSYFLGSSKLSCADIETTVSSGTSILVIGSDYADCFVPFLAPHYSRITVVDPMNLDGESMTKYADPEDYDAVLFLYDVESFCSGSGLGAVAE